MVKNVVASVGSIDVTMMDLYNAILFRKSLLSIPSAQCGSMWYNEDIRGFANAASPQKIRHLNLLLFHVTHFRNLHHF